MQLSLNCSTGKLCQLRMTPGVVGYYVSVVVYLLQNTSICQHLLANTEKSRLHAILFQNTKNLGRIYCVGTIIKCQCNFRKASTALEEDAALDSKRNHIYRAQYFP